MTELLTAAQMRNIEQAAIDSGEVTGLELMERAGRGVVDAIFEEWPELAKTSHRAVVLCGPGNNGGDGFVVARLLKEWGWEVEVFLYGDPGKLPPDARVNYERWGQKTSAFTEEESGGNRSANAEIFVDALFGTGLKRALVEPRELYWVVYDRWMSTLDRRKALSPKIVSIDTPSGICADSGLTLASEDAAVLNVPANLTVSFHRPKQGHFLAEGPHCSGRLIVKEIGLSSNDEAAVRLATPHGLQSMDPHLIKDRDHHHKYAHGHALVLSGGPGKTGAARLTARGALRIGAGLVTIACPQNALAEVAAQTTAIMCRTLDGPPGLREALEDERLNALCLGPGLGLGPDTQALVLEALGGAGVKPRPMVLDADALTRFERNPQVLFDALHDQCVLTPHGGEFKRLFPDIAEKLEGPATTGPAYSKVDATRDAAKRAGCTILFKGPDTVIADQTGRCSINSSAYERAAPWLATAGSGDVLAGFITGLLARGFPAMQAAETAAWLHTECALSFGPGLIAEDIPEELPKVFRALFNEP